MTDYRVLQDAYIGEGLRQEGDIVSDDVLGKGFKYNEDRDGGVLEPIGGKKAARAAKDNADADRTLTDGKLSRDPATDTGGVNDKGDKDLA